MGQHDSQLIAGQAMDTDCGKYSEDRVVSILRVTEELNSLKDVDAILDKTLFEARALAGADAGSIFLKEGDSLRFSYVHNDTLFREDEANVAVYADFSVPINKESIVGYTARTGESLVIDDAYRLPEGLPYRFNPSFDHQAGYHTRSILTIPLKTFENRLVGVMQLINALNDHKEPIPFARESQVYVPLFANNAAVAIERGIMHRELVLRMMRMAELRDPSETGTHVQRVGAYAAEIYQRYAYNRGLDKKEIKRTRDLIRVTAMLHDVGKVGISDLILKKPAKLTAEEFDVMKWHTVFGARLFVNPTSELDRMSRDIALNHHEKWGGGGYPGKLSDILVEKISMGVPKQGEEIPLAARITTLADVYDALASKRSYKQAWAEDDVLDAVAQGAGSHFDPELVEAFFQITDVIQAIHARYPEVVAAS
jgi:HD-GYP domain-containing protein (c-di-GMP phosphodiesterase class II)